MRMPSQPSVVVLRPMLPSMVVVQLSLLPSVMAVDLS
jgi:hypothetical protein